MLRNGVGCMPLVQMDAASKEGNALRCDVEKAEVGSMACNGAASKARKIGIRYCVDLASD